MNKELKRLLHEQRANEDYHLSLEDEFKFYRQIASGDVELAKNYENNDTEGQGILSKNATKNERYHSIILIAMITRFCIENGLDSEEAYTLSDLFIRRIDECLEIVQIQEIKKQAIIEFAQAMKDLHTNNINHLQVKRGIDFIQKNLTKPISASDVGEATNCNPDYLSRLFKKETGLTLGKYILGRKCAAACYMLENSSESVTEISAFLGFASASHFIKRFSEYIGMTPEKYRTRHNLY